MRVAEDFDELAGLLDGSPGSTITIGVFDGLHAGHQALIRRTVTEAHKRGVQSVVATFKTHPIEVLAPPYTPRRLIYPDRKQRYVSDLGVDLMVNLTFDADFARQNPEEFVRRKLLEKARIQAIVCGYDFSFGHRGSGSSDLLRRLGNAEGFDVIVLDPVDDGGVAVKSTMVRDLLLTGHVADAMRYLTRPYELRGNVVTGFARGRTLGFPTANLDVDSLHVIPLPGVYACLAELRGSRELRGAIVNIGHKPTFGPLALTIEAHLLNFSGELVGHEIALFFLRRMRDERKFESTDALVDQLKRDQAEAIAFLETKEMRQTASRVEQLIAAS